jgi:hypothetical protein
VSVVMDTTFKTNRFGWPLLIVCGVNEHGQTVVFAVAVLHHQTTEMFTWALSCMKEAVTDADWATINTVVTDGDPAMAAAVGSVWPHVHPIRCIFHLALNIRDKFRDLGVPIIDERFITAWKAVINTEEVADFEAGKARLVAPCAEAQAYLTDFHWKNEELFALCYTKRWTTLGQRSTQRVEGVNGVLKGMLKVRSSTAMQTLLETLQWASSEVDRQAVATAAAHAADHPRPAAPRTFAEEVQPHLTSTRASRSRRRWTSATTTPSRRRWWLGSRACGGCQITVWSQSERRSTGGRLKSAMTSCAAVATGRPCTCCRAVTCSP